MLGPVDHGLRYYGYEPASYETKMLARGISNRVAAERAASTDREKIKAAGFVKAAHLGMSREAAIAKAKNIEAATGVQMRVINHDYL